jgi:hypothetical protein
MANGRPCAVCETMTSKFLFKDKALGIPICSRKCQYEYVDSLTSEDREQPIVLRYVDRKIDATRRINRLCWGISGVGIVLIVFAFVIADPLSFIAGNVLVISGTLSTRYLEDRIFKLTKLRKRIEI